MRLDLSFLSLAPLSGDFQTWLLYSFDWNGAGEGRSILGQYISLYNCLKEDCVEVVVGLFSHVTVIGGEVMTSSCTREGLGWILGKKYSLKEW